MFSRSCFIVCLIFVSSCSWWGEKKIHQNDYEVKNSFFKGQPPKCINQTGSFFASYFKGHTISSQVEDFVSCLEDTGDNLFNVAKSKSGKVFSQKNIENAILSLSKSRGKFEASQKARLILVIKTLFIGGSSNSINLKEWELLKNKLGRLKENMLESKESIKYIFYSDRADLNKRENAYIQNIKLFKTLDDIKNENQGHISTKDLLFVADFILSNEKLEKFKGLATKAVQLVYPEGAFTDKRPALFSKISSIFLMQSRFRELKFPEGFMFGEGTLDLIESMRVVSSNLLEWSKTNSRYSVKVSLIQDIISELYKIGLFKDRFSDVLALNEVVGKLFKKLFKTDQLAHKSFDYFNTEVQSWSNGLIKIISDFDFSWFKANKDLFKENEIYRASAEKNLEYLVGFNKPTFVSVKDGPIKILYEKKRLFSREIYFDRVFKFSLTTLAVLIMKAYGQNGRKWEKPEDISLSPFEISELFSDFRPVGLDMGFSNPYNCDSKDRVLLEANTLTWNGDGNDQVSLAEAVEWLGTMLSVSSISNHVFTQSLDNCFYEGKESFGYPFLKRKCFANHLFSRNQLYLSFFTKLQDYTNRMSSESMRAPFLESLKDNFSTTNHFGQFDREKFEDKILGALNSCKSYEDFPVSRAEFNASVAVNIYLENLFAQFDKSSVKRKVKTGWFLKEEREHEGPDLIIDGAELSELIKAKLTDEMQDKVVAFLKTQSWTLNLVSNENAKKRLRNLNDRDVLLDRYKMLSLINIIVGQVETKKPHPLQEDFCASVNLSARTGFIDYDDSTSIKCEREESLPSAGAR